MDFVRYTSLKESLDDSAYALFRHGDDFTLASAGPGFSPDGLNKWDHAWGWALPVGPETAALANLSNAPEIESMGGGMYLEPFPFNWWEDESKALPLLRSLAAALEDR